MPTKAGHACIEPTCRQVVRDSNPRCQAHRRAYDHARTPGTDRSYAHLYRSLQWRRLRLDVLTMHPRCQCDRCATAPFGQWRMADAVHHIRPHGGNEALFFDRSNLQAINGRCHSRVTMEDMNERAR